MDHGTRTHPTYVTVVLHGRDHVLDGALDEDAGDEPAGLAVRIEGLQRAQNHVVLMKFALKLADFLEDVLELVLERLKPAQDLRLGRKLLRVRERARRRDKMDEEEQCIRGG